MVEKTKGRRLTWSGHVERTRGKILLNAALRGHVIEERSRGRQRKRWVNNVRDDLDETDMQLSTAYEKTKNR